MVFTRVAFRVHLRVHSESAKFVAQFVFRVCLRGASEAPPTSAGRQMAPLKWLPVQPIRIVLFIANGSHYGGRHFEKPFQPIKVVLLIANGGHL